MTKVHHRTPGAAVCALDCDQAYAEFICDGEHLHPAIIRMAHNCKPSDKFVLITDSMCATCAKDGHYMIAGTEVFVKNGRATDANGTLAGSTLTMFVALKNIMKFCSIPLTQAIKYATVNPANMVKANNVGSIEKGYRADFIALSDIVNPQMDCVYVGANRVE